MKFSVNALLRRLSSVHIEHRRIARSAVWVAYFVLISKLAAAGRDVAIAWRYGVGETVDAYQLALTLIFWLPITITSALVIVAVPILVRLRRQTENERSIFCSELLGWGIAAGITSGVMSVVLSPFVLPYLASQLSANTSEMALKLVLGMAPAAPISLMIGVYASRVMSSERHGNTLAEAIPPTVILLFVLVWPGEVDVSPLLYGTFVGIVMHASWLSRLAYRADNGTVVPRFSKQSPHWKELWRAAGVMAAGQLVMSFITPLDQFTAARLGDGAVATLGYANRLIGLLLGIGALAITRAILPVMADLHSAGRFKEAHSITIKWAALMLSAGAVVAAIAWMLAPWAIRVLFERGAFNAQNTQLVSEVFRWGVVQVPFYLVGLAFVQFLASQGRYGVIAVFAATNLGVKAALNMPLSLWLGVPGIALATAVMYAWSALCLWSAVVRSTGRLRDDPQ